VSPEAEAKVPANKDATSAPDKKTEPAEGQPSPLRPNDNVDKQVPDPIVSPNTEEERWDNDKVLPITAVPPEAEAKVPANKDAMSAPDMNNEPAEGHPLPPNNNDDKQISDPILAPNAEEGRPNNPSASASEMNNGAAVEQPSTPEGRNLLRQSLSPDGMYSLVGRRSFLGDQRQIPKIDLDSEIEIMEAKLSTELDNPKDPSGSIWKFVSPPATSKKKVDLLYFEKKRQEQRDKEKEQQRTADPPGDYDKKEPTEPEKSNNDDTGERTLIQIDPVGKSPAKPRVAGGSFLGQLSASLVSPLSDMFSPKPDGPDKEGEMDTKDSDSNPNDSSPPKEGPPERGLL
jgi:hypothetical protein